MSIKNQSELKIIKNNGYKYIYIYYKHKGTILRANTKFKYQKSYCTADFLFNSKYPNFINDNLEIEKLKNKVDEYIRLKLSSNQKVNQKELNDWIKGDAKKTLFGTYNFPSKASTPVKKSTTFIDQYKSFYDYKKKELNNRPSSKDYLSLQNALLDWETKNKKTLTFDSVNSMDFMVDFRLFLCEGRTEEKYLTTGGLNDNTIHKRFSCLKTFMKWIECEEIFTFKPSVKYFRVDKYENDVIALNKTDIQLLLDVKTTSEVHQRIIDLFVFNCFAGLRFSDLMQLNKANFVKDEDGDYAIEQENQKTKFKVIIPLQKHALIILEKYKFDLPKFSSQYFNRELKKVLEEYELFADPIIKKRRSFNDVKDFLTIKRKQISSHTCRRTFITLAMNSKVPLTNIMAASGHKKLQTLKKYTKIDQDKKAFKAIDL
jgi:integrase